MPVKKKAFVWFKVNVRVTSEWNNILDGYDSNTNQIFKKKKNSSLKHRQDLAKLF